MDICADGIDTRRKCVGSVCQLGERTGVGCSGDLPCPLDLIDEAPDIGPLPETVIFGPNGETIELYDPIAYEDIAPMAGTISTGYPDGNPKTAMGAKKPDISVVPPAGILHLATAMMNGADKYGPFNWRDHPISARPYIAAAQRHLCSYLDGEDYSQDTTLAGKPVHHLAHVMACCAILLDAAEIGSLNDNRPKVKGPSGDMIERFNEKTTFAKDTDQET